MTSKSDPRGHPGLKLCVHVSVMGYYRFINFHQNRRGSGIFLGDFTWNDPELSVSALLLSLTWGAFRLGGGGYVHQRGSWPQDDYGSVAPWIHPYRCVDWNYFCHKRENWLFLRVRPRAERVSRQPAEISANELSGSVFRLCSIICSTANNFPLLFIILRVFFPLLFFTLTWLLFLRWVGEYGRAPLTYRS